MKTTTIHKAMRAVAAVLAATCMSLTMPLHAQMPHPFNESELLQPSAQSWRVSHYGAEELQGNTGAMTASIPIHTYADPDFELPVTLSYNYCGFRPAQGSGTVGYGWSLVCGGAVTRTVRGIPDETEAGYDNSNVHGYYHTSDKKYHPDEIPSSYADNMVLSSMFQSPSAACGFDEVMEGLEPYGDTPCWRSNDDGLIESWPDVFHFSAPGLSGDFILSGGPGGQCLVVGSNVPEGELTVTYTPGPHVQGTIYAPTVTITTGLGCIYEFGGCMSSIEYTRSFDTMGDGGVEYSVTPVSFYLRSIKAPNGRKLEMTYCDEHRICIVSRTSYTPFKRCVSNTATGTRYSSAHKVMSATWSPLLTGVMVEGHPVFSMEYVHDISDEFAESCFSQQGMLTTVNYMHGVFHSGQAVRLSSIRVTDMQGASVDDISLAHFQTMGGHTPRLFLSEVSIRSAGRFSFTYNESPGSSFGYRDLEGTDHWGFANGRGSDDMRRHLMMPSMLPGSLYSQMLDDHRDPCFAYGSRCALVVMEYPTGGISEIEYEPHHVSRRRDRTPGNPPSLTYCQEMEVGGARVRSIVDTAPEGESFTRSYTYELSVGNGMCSGCLNIMPRYVLPASFNYRNLSADIGDAIVHVESYAYSGEHDIQVMSEPAVTYSAVQVRYPDGSIRERSYLTDADVPDLHIISGTVHGIDEDSDFDMYVKRCFGERDSIDEDQSMAASYKCFLAPPVIDRSLMREMVSSERSYNSEGVLTECSQYMYAEHATVTKDLLVNLVMWNCRMAMAICSPRLVEVWEDRVEGGTTLRIRHSVEYNSLGQVTARTDSDNQLGLSRTTVTSYCHEEAPDVQGLSPLAGAVRSEATLSGSAETMRVTYFYDSSCPANPYPLRVVVRREGEERITEYIYDSRFRKMLVNRPGGRWTALRWSCDSRHLLSREDNYSGNETCFTWQDMVGLSSIVLPTGCGESYLYDAKGRLSERRNTDGEQTISYMYNLVNE